MMLLHACEAEVGGGKQGGTQGKPFRKTNSLRINLPYYLFHENNQDWRVSAPVTSQALMNKGGGYTKVSRAQDKEDIWLYENWFYGKERGVIVESGALDGMMYSTTHMFEKWAEWTSVHIEADPRNYFKLIRQREKSININAALCGEPKLLHYTNDDGGQIQGFVEFMSPSFIRKWHKGIHKGKTKIEDLPTVQCVQMKKIMHEMNVKHIDIWILDVEGAEQSVLEGTDFDKLDISTVVMECDHHDEEKDQKKRDILEANGFECQEVERNCFCKHVSFTPSTMPAENQLYSSYRDATGPKIH